MLQIVLQVVIFVAVILFANIQVNRSLSGVRDQFRATLLGKTELLGRSLEVDVATAITFHTFDQAAELFKKKVDESTSEVSFILALDENGAPLFASTPARMAAPLTLREADRQLQRGQSHVDSEYEDDAAMGEKFFRVTVPMFDQQTEQRAGFLILGVPESAVAQKLKSASAVNRQVSGWLIALLVIVVVVNLIGYVVLNQIFVRPIGLLQRSAEVIASGDLSADVEPWIRAKKDEVGGLGEAFYQMTEAIRRVVRSIQESLGMVLASSKDIQQSSHRVAGASQSQSQSVNRTFQSVEEINVAIGRIGENIDVLAASSEESSSSILELNAIIDEISENADQLASAVEDTTSSISQMTTSIHQVKENVEQLSVAADETASSVSELDASIKAIEGNAEQTTRLAAGFSNEAGVGLEAVNQTIESIQKVHKSSHEAAAVMEALGGRIDEIGKILNVIDDVAEQTNLLALNAAIIAAQAGEHGKSFAVVADEIKDLAERTAASTAEIATIIKAVQSESTRAISSVFQSTKLVEEGVRRSEEAGNVLRRIAGSSQGALTMVKDIARATVEQAHGSAQITGAVDKIVNMVLQINVATTEQAKNSTEIMTAAQKMKEITILVRGATREQSKGAKQINEAMDRVIQMVDYINGAIKEQRGGSGKVVSEMEAIRSATQANVDAAKAMDRAVGDLRKQAEALKSEVQRFSL